MRERDVRPWLGREVDVLWSGGHIVDRAAFIQGDWLHFSSGYHIRIEAIGSICEAPSPADRSSASVNADDRLG